MKTVRIFPDYCSSGIWTDEGNTSLTCLGIQDDVIEIAMRNWHNVLEYILVEDCRKLFSDEFYKKWVKDGEKIVTYLNNQHVHNGYVFILGLSHCGVDEYL